MNRAILKADGKQRKGRPGPVQKKLTIHDLKIGNEFEELYSFLEERYGYSKEKAKEEVDRRIRR